MATSVPALDLSIKISDLSDTSHLKSLLQNEAGQIFQFAQEIQPYWNSEIGEIASGTNVSFNLSESGNWKTSTGIGFGLTATAVCELQIITSGSVIDYQAEVDSSTTSSLPADAYGGYCYVKLSVSFEIDGNVSGSGNVGAIGISGNAKGSTDASLVFAHRVASNIPLSQAVVEALDDLVFPFQPSCASDMTEGDIAQVNFNGTLSCNFSVSYGLGKYSFAAPSVTTALSKTTAGGVQLNLPSGTISIGASASIGYTHSDDFTAIVEKTGETDAFLYLMRAHKNDITGGVGLVAKITFAQPGSVNVDTQTLQQALVAVVGNAGAAKVVAQANTLEQTLNDKISGWVNNAAQNGTGIDATWDAQHNTTMLFKYAINLTNISLRDRSWLYFCAGNITSAVTAGGLVLESGSGVNDEISHSFTISLTFFNLFYAKDVNTFFQNSTVMITDTGDVRFLFDIGKEGDTDINGILQKARVHFVADALANKPADVKLQFELSETKNPNEARHVAAVAGYLTPSQAASSAYNDMQQFIAAQPNGTLNLTCILESSAYGKLTCSQFVNNHPPQDQTLDEKNYDMFHDASVRLLDIDWAQNVSYAIWQGWNVASIDQLGGNATPNRESEGNPYGSDAMEFWTDNLGASGSHGILLLDYFGIVSSSFMNLCDSLQSLADFLTHATMPNDWNTLLETLRAIVDTDVNTDYAKPTVAAILKLCAPQQVNYSKQASGTSMTCILNLA